MFEPLVLWGPPFLLALPFNHIEKEDPTHGFSSLRWDVSPPDAAYCP